MQANWSLILNVLLLIGVIVAIGRIMKARRHSLSPKYSSPCLEAQESPDEIISIRKINLDPVLEKETDTDTNEEVHLFTQSKEKSSKPRLMPQDSSNEIQLRKESQIPNIKKDSIQRTEVPSLIIMFLLAKENRQFAGYELLQTVLAAGLRFGEGQLFHRHQFSNGQGPILCSLATATATGVFDLQNIGAFSVRGLCLYMHPSKNPGIDIDRFAVMLETARQLTEGLDAYLLDDQRKPLTEERIIRYHRLLNIESMLDIA